MTVTRKLALATGLVTLMVAQAAQAQVYKYLPADSLVVFKATNLEAASKKVGNFNTQVGLAQMKPEAGDPLKAIEDQSGIQAGLNTAGDMAFAFLDPKDFGGDNNKSLLVLIPVSDYKAFLGNFSDAKTDGDISEFHFKGDNDPSYAAQWGEYAAVSPSKEIVSKKPDGITLGGLAAKEVEGKDFSLLANFKVLRTKLLPDLEANRQKLIDQMDAQIKNNPQVAKFQPVLDAAFGQVLNIAKEFVSDCNASTVSVNFGNDGIGSTLMAEFDDNTYIAHHVKEFKNTGDSFLGGLPEGKYLFFGGGANDPKIAGEVLNDVLDPVVKQLSSVQGFDAKPLNDYVDALKKIVASSTGSATGVFAPAGALGQDPLLQFVQVQHGDSKAIAESQKQLFDSQQTLMKAFGGPAAEQAKTTFKEGARTVDNVSFNEFTTTFNMNPSTPQEMQAAMMLGYLYGPNGMDMISGQVNDQTLLIASGLPDATLSAAIAAAKTNDSPLSKLAAVKAVSSQLPDQRLAEVYFPLDQLVSTGVNYAKQFGLATGVTLPADLPPIGATVATEGTAIRIDSYYPSQLIQALVSAGMQAYMQVNQQNGAAPAGGAAPQGGNGL